MGTSDIQSVSSWQKREREIGKGQLCSSVKTLTPPTFFIAVFWSSGKPSPPTSLIRFPWTVSDGAAPPPPRLAFWSPFFVWPLFLVTSNDVKRGGIEGGGGSYWGGLANIQGYLAKCTPWLLTCFTRRVVIFVVFPDNSVCVCVCVWVAKDDDMYSRNIAWY